jgi:transcription factor TFIIIB component B''
MQEVAAATQEQQESYEDDLVDESGKEDAGLNAETNVCVSLLTFILVSK